MAVLSSPALYKDKKNGTLGIPLALGDTGKKYRKEEHSNTGLTFQGTSENANSQHDYRRLKRSSGSLGGTDSPQTTAVQGQPNRNKKSQVPEEFREPIPRPDKWMKVRWFGGLLILGVLSLSPHHAAAFPVNGYNTYEPGCSVAGSSREDDVLDSLDLQDGLDGRNFDGSNRGYSRVCTDALHDVSVQEISLQGNFLSSLPEGLFDHIIGLEILNLGGNNFTAFPSALNSSTSIKFLDISDNNIVHIDRGTMNGMIGTSTIDFSGNENMVQVPGDIFSLLENSLKRVILTGTQVQHPLIPVPRNMVFMNPLYITNKGTLVSIQIDTERKATFEVSLNGTMSCEEVKDILTYEYEIMDGEVSCRNNLLDGAIKIVRNGNSYTQTTEIPAALEIHQKTASAAINVTATDMNQNLALVGLATSRRRIVVGTTLAFVFGLIVGILVMRVFPKGIVARDSRIAMTSTSSNNSGASQTNVSESAPQNEIDDKE